MEWKKQKSRDDRKELSRKKSPEASQSPEKKRTKTTSRKKHHLTLLPTETTEKKIYREEKSAPVIPTVTTMVRNEVSNGMKDLIEEGRVDSPKLDSTNLNSDLWIVSNSESQKR